MEFKLNLLDGFRCLAGECPLTCCHGWNVSIDNDTLADWQAATSPDLRNLLDGATEIPSKGAESQTVMRASANGDCIMLDESSLCRLQSLAGHDSLPQTCRDFPRRYRNESLRNIATASMTCPAITQKLFELIGNSDLYNETGNIKPLSFNLDFDLIQANGLDELSREVINNNRFSISIRLLYLAKTLGQLATDSTSQPITEARLKQIIGKPKQQLYDLNIAVKNKRIKISPLTGGQFWYLIYFLSQKSDGSSILDEFAGNDFINMANSLANASSEQDFIDFYAVLSEYRSKAMPHLDELNRFAANYFTVKFMNNGFPLQPYWGNFTATFLNCVLPYALIHFYLWLQFKHQGSLSSEEIMMGVTKVERHLDHGQKIYQILESHPQFQQVELFAECLLDLG